MADTRTAAEIERDLAATRARLAESIAELITEVHPKAVAHRTVVSAKKRGRRAVAGAKSAFKDDAGWNVRNLAIAGVALAGIIVLIVVSHQK